MLAIMAKRVGHWGGERLGLQKPGGWDLGEIFAFWVSLDAFVVLSGAVLTAYVGISGLIARMAKDRVLPQIMLRKARAVLLLFLLSLLLSLWFLRFLWFFVYVFQSVCRYRSLSSDLFPIYDVAPSLVLLEMSYHELPLF